MGTLVGPGPAEHRLPSRRSDAASVRHLARNNFQRLGELQRGQVGVLAPRQQWTPRPNVDTVGAASPLPAIVTSHRRRIRRLWSSRSTTPSKRQLTLLGRQISPQRLQELAGVRFPLAPPRNVCDKRAWAQRRASSWCPDVADSDGRSRDCCGRGFDHCGDRIGMADQGEMGAPLKGGHLGVCSLGHGLFGGRGDDLIDIPPKPWRPEL